MIKNMILGQPLSKLFMEPFLKAKLSINIGQTETKYFQDWDNPDRITFDLIFCPNPCKKPARLIGLVDR